MAFMAAMHYHADEWMRVEGDDFDAGGADVRLISAAYIYLPASTAGRHAAPVSILT